MPVLSNFSATIFTQEMQIPVEFYNVAAVRRGGHPADREVGNDCNRGEAGGAEGLHLPDHTIV